MEQALEMMEAIQGKWMLPDISVNAHFSPDFV